MGGDTGCDGTGMDQTKTRGSPTATCRQRQSKTSVNKMGSTITNDLATHGVSFVIKNAPVPEVPKSTNINANTDQTCKALRAHAQTAR